MPLLHLFCVATILRPQVGRPLQSRRQGACNKAVLPDSSQPASCVTSGAPRRSNYDHFFASFSTRAGTPHEPLICPLLSAADKIRFAKDGSQKSKSSR